MTAIMRKSVPVVERMSGRLVLHPARQDPENRRHPPPARAPTAAPGGRRGIWRQLCRSAHRARLHGGGHQVTAAQTPGKEHDGS
jgi:hypothetical protein